MRRSIRKDKEEKKSEPEVRTLISSNENEPAIVIYIIIGGPSGTKGTSTNQHGHLQR